MSVVADPLAARRPANGSNSPIYKTDAVSQGGVHPSCVWCRHSAGGSPVEATAGLGLSTGDDVGSTVDEPSR